MPNHAGTLLASRAPHTSAARSAMMNCMPPVSPLAETARAFALGLPETWEDHPWGESVAKVGRKVFVFFGGPDTDARLRFTVKLRDSHEEAMSMPWVTPAGYGLDRGGWVTCAPPGDTPIEMITGWIEESYRLVAPRRLSEPLARPSG
jgi:predicted DNA-binding protein (MmcQ/YjbR family)